MVAVIWLYEPVAPLTEALNSYWLVIHVVSAIIATGAFTLGGIASAMYLVKMRAAATTTTGSLARVPSLDVARPAVLPDARLRFPVWTFAVLITGPIWAHQAWSSYWNWDPKEVWAFITWVVYAGYLHARATAGWKGRNAALLALVGLATLWFNFIGINYFCSSSQHSYAAPSARSSRACSELRPLSDPSGGFSRLRSRSRRKSSSSSGADRSCGGGSALRERPACRAIRPRCWMTRTAR